MKVAWAAKIGVLADGGGFVGMPGCLVGADEGGDTLAVQSADLDGAGGNGLSLARVYLPVEIEDAKACSKALFGMRAAGKNGDHQPLGLGAD